MSYYSSHYRDDREIHAGDTFFDGHEEHLVTVVLGWDEALPQWRSWLAGFRATNSAGFLCQSWISGPIFYEESDEDQVLVARDVSVPDPGISPRDGPFTVEFYDVGPMVNLNSLAQDPAALGGARVARTGTLSENSTAVAKIHALLRDKRGLWRYINFCIVPVIVVKTTSFSVGFQKGWVIANPHNPARQFVAPLVEEEYRAVLDLLRHETE